MMTRPTFSRGSSYARSQLEPHRQSPLSITSSSRYWGTPRESPIGPITKPSLCILRPRLMSPLTRPLPDPWHPYCNVNLKATPCSLHVC